MTRPPNAFAAPPRMPELPPEGLPGEPLDAPTPAVVKPRPDIASLRFLDPSAVMTSVELKYPFVYQDGADEIAVSKIDIRRLGVWEVAEIVKAARSAEDLDFFPFYAAMTGLPAAVLRAMPDDEEVIAACVPFLPATVRQIMEVVISAYGAAISSPPRAPAENPSPES